MLDPVLKNPWVRALGALLALCALAILLFLLKPVLVPLFFAFIVAYVLDPAVDFFETRKVRRSIAIGLFAFIGITLALSIPLYVVPNIVVQADQLVSATQKGIQDQEGLYGWFRAVANRLPLDDIIAILDEESRSSQQAEPVAPSNETSEQLDQEASLVQNESEASEVSEDSAEQPDAEASPQTSETDESAATPAAETERDPFAVLTEILATRIRSSAVEFFQSNSEQLATAGVTAGQGIAQFLATAGRRFIGVFLFFGKFFLFAFVAGYLLKDYDRIVAVGKGLLPLERRAYIADIFSKIDGQLRSVLRGQAIVCLFLAAIYSVGLTISGVPFALPLGIF
ncbi:MAG: AI-2E family transporter, partial [Candidatus Hydrogenedentota bacterium]